MGRNDPGPNRPRPKRPRPKRPRAETTQGRNDSGPKRPVTICCCCCSHKFCPSRHTSSQGVEFNGVLLIVCIFLLCHHIKFAEFVIYLLCHLGMDNVFDNKALFCSVQKVHTSTTLFIFHTIFFNNMLKQSLEYIIYCRLCV